MVFGDPCERMLGPKGIETTGVGAGRHVQRESQTQKAIGVGNSTENIQNVGCRLKRGGWEVEMTDEMG